jgi:hypothetical protein
MSCRKVRLILSTGVSVQLAVKHICHSALSYELEDHKKAKQSEVLSIEEVLLLHGMLVVHTIVVF